MSSSPVEHWDRVRELYEQADRLPPADRAAFLRDAAERELDLRDLLDRLLGSGQPPDDFLAAPGSSALAAIGDATTPRLNVGGEFAGYTIRELLGSGGTSVVYRAEQERPRRDVALKVMRGVAISARSLRRFEHEAELLARLKHPNIATVHEADTADTPLGPQPFIAMEFVTGRPITDHVAATQIEPAACLRLFVRLCAAVSHAHQRGVIHRDLKPGNIFVEADGTPKILDFGVARLINEDAPLSLATQPGDLVGTLAYMSPEQAAGGAELVDVRSDIYSLGVILYELLSGQLPYSVAELPLPDAIRVIREQGPDFSKHVARPLRGDLATIVSTALQKDPARRYASAAALGDDLERVLDNQPILARQASSAYQFRKLVARHRLPFALATILFVVTLSSAIGLGMLASKFAKERDDAEQARARAAESRASAEAFVGVLSDLFHWADPMRAETDEPTVRQILEQGYRDLEQVKEPVARARLMVVMSRAFHGLGQRDRATSLLNDAITMLREQPDVDPYVISDALLELAFRSSSAPLATEALELRQREFGEDHPYTAAAWNRRGEIHFYASRHREALENFEQALTIWQSDADQYQQEVANALANCGASHRELGNTEEAERYLKEALAVGVDQRRRLLTLESLAMLVWQRDQHEAVERFAEIVETAREIFRPDHPRLAWYIRNYAFTVGMTQGWPAAEPLHREAADIHRRAYEGDHQELAQSLDMLGACLMDNEKWAEAEPVLTEAFEMRQRVHGPEHSWTMDTKAKLDRAREQLTSQP